MLTTLSNLQAVLYGYYIVSAMGLRAMSPSLALMTSQEAHLSGSFRSAHQVLCCRNFQCVARCKLRKCLLLAFYS